MLSNSKLYNSKVRRMTAVDALYCAGVNLKLIADLSTLNEILCLQVLYLLQIPICQLDDGALGEVRGQWRGWGWRRSSQQAGRGWNHRQMQLGLNHSCSRVRVWGWSLKSLYFWGHWGDESMGHCRSEGQCGRCSSNFSSTHWDDDWLSSRDDQVLG